MGPTIGQRIRELRGKLLSQRELAERAGVSVDLIRKLEQGVRHTASVPSLQRIARALDVSAAELLGNRSAQPSTDPAAGVVAIRRALTPVDDLIGHDVDVLDGLPLTLAEAERTVKYLWCTYWAGRYELLSSLLHSALLQLRATHRAVPAGQRAQAAHALARAYQAAGDTLVHLGHQDAAWLAVREAMQAAERGNNALLCAALRISVSWQLLIQGRYEESERVAVVAADSITPTKPSECAAFGLLTVTAATAAARAQRRDAAAELLGAARAVANRLGHDRADHQSTFGPAKVAMLSVDVHVVQEEYPAALSAAKALPRDADLPLASRARHLADVAMAQLRTGRHERALQTMLTMERMAPDWIKYQPLPRQITAELVEHHRRLPAPLRDLAIRLGAIAG